MKQLRTVLGLVAFAALVAAPIAYYLRPAPPPLRSLYPMPAFSLTTEQGRRLAAKDLVGKVVVANFIFTSCPTVCPTLTAHMARIQQRFAKNDGVHLLSFSVDPKNDTPEKMAAFAKEYGQDPARWSFLTGDIQAVEKAIVEGFKIHIDGAGDPEATAFDIVHGEHFVVIDANGIIREYYQPTAGDLERLADDVERLLDEP